MDVAALLPDLRAYARFLARQRSEADDLVQEALVRALGALEQYQAGTNLRSWLFTIVRNTFFEQTRRRRTEQAALARAASEDRGHPPAADHDSAIALNELEQGLWSLPPLLREALVLVGAQELSYEDAATICGVPVGTMKARVSRARTQLKHRLSHPTEPSIPPLR